MSKKLLLASVACLLALSFILTPSWGAEKVSFATHFKRNPHYGLPAWAAMDQGYWRQMGLDPEWITFDSATTMARAIVAGHIDTGTNGLIALIRAVSSGVPQITVGDTGITTQFYFWVLADSRLKKPQDLKGAKIGVTRFGGDSHAFAQAVVKTLGMEGQVKFLSMGGGTNQMAGLRSGAIDISNLSNFTMAALKARGIVREYLALEEHLPKGLSTQILFARKDFLKSKPEVVRRINAGYFKGADFIMKNKGWAIRKIKEGVLSKYNDEAARAAYPLLRYEGKGKIDIVKVRSVRKFLIDFGILAKDKTAPLEAYYAKEYAK